jgi:hypothetical protein
MSSSLSGASTGKSLLDVIMRFFSEAVNPPVQCGTVDFSRDEGITFCAFSQRSIYFPLFSAPAASGNSGAAPGFRARRCHVSLSVLSPGVIAAGR